MIDYLEILFCTTFAYLIGSVPIGFWIGRFRYGIDIREHGSGSSSHLNIMRILGPYASYLTRAINVLKGFLAASLALYIHNRYGVFSEYEYPVLSLTLGLAAILGHIFPVFAGFRGGKGYHVTLGVLFAINPLVTLVFAAGSFMMLLISRYPHLGYVTGALLVPLFVLLNRGIFGVMTMPLTVFGFILTVILIYSNRNNLLRILRGTEPRMSLRIPRLR